MIVEGVVAVVADVVVAVVDGAVVDGVVVVVDGVIVEGVMASRRILFSPKNKQNSILR